MVKRAFLLLGLPATLGLLAREAPGPSARERVRRDIDVAIPPGSPLEWSRAIPRTPLHPGLTAPLTHPSDPGPGERRTVSSPRGGWQTGLPSSFGLLRILTWDLGAHIGWIGQFDTPNHPFTRGGGEVPFPPAVSRPFYWMTLAPLLRILLHPQRVSSLETIAHLIELGEPTLPALEAARSEDRLAKLIDQIEAAIGPFDRSPPRPLPGADARAAVVNRFVLGELVAGHPYDPEMTFGRRLYLLGDQIVPSLIAHLDHPHAFVRRNAVVALGRFGSSAALKALARVAARSKDPVQRLRALAVLALQHYAPAVDPLVRRLGQHLAPWEQVALIYTLGRLGSERGIAAIVARGRAGDRAGEVLMAALAALARIHPPASSRSIVDWLASVRGRALRSPGRWKVAPARGELMPDRPDGPAERGTMIAQLALLAEASLTPADSGARGLVLALGSPRGSEASAGVPVRGYENATLAGVSPVARFLFLETLARLGEEGRERLVQVVLDASADPLLRMFALRLLGGTRRLTLCRRLAPDPEEEAGLRTQALVVLDQSYASGVVAIARGILARFSARGLERLEAAQRYLLLVALRTLGRRGALKTPELIALQGELLVRPRVAQSIRAAVRAQVEELVDRVRRRRPRREVHAKIDGLLDFLIAQRINPRLDDASRAVFSKYLQGQLSALGSRRDASFVQTVIDSIQAYLLDLPQSYRVGKVEFRPRIPLLETLLLELGRTGELPAVLTLARIVRDRRHPQRAVACLALGASGQRSAGPHLLAALGDRDGFVRYCAYEALRRLSGRDFFADWFGGAPADRKAAVEAYRAWLAKER